MENTKFKRSSLQKWGGIASFLVAIALVSSSFIYLAGNLRDAWGPFSYSLADFLYGPVWAASIITAVLALRERISTAAKTQMNLALLASFAAACAFVVVASIRSSNRHYHLIHPELHLESSELVLTVWGAQVAGVIGAAFHFLGWAFVLIGSASWASRQLPRILCILYWLVGAICLLVLFFPDLEAHAIALAMIVSIWQGILLLHPEPMEGNSEIKNSMHDSS